MALVSWSPLSLSPVSSSSCDANLQHCGVKQLANFLNAFADILLHSTILQYSSTVVAAAGARSARRFFAIFPGKQPNYRMRMRRKRRQARTRATVWVAGVPEPLLMPFHVDARSTKKKGLATCAASPFEARRPITNRCYRTLSMTPDQKFLRTRMPTVRGAPYTTLLLSRPPPVPMAAM